MRLSLDCNEGADGDTLFEVQLAECEIPDYEWIEDGKPYREWLIPPAIVNTGAIRCRPRHGGGMKVRVDAADSVTHPARLDDPTHAGGVSSAGQTRNSTEL
jgi:hypothetical protein